MERLNINSITRLRIHSDGKGVRSVCFLQHCPLDCFWCCNPETRFDTRFRKLTLRQLYSYIREDIPYFLFSGGGITFSGGEPLLQADFIRAFAEEYCREFTVDLETSLYAPWETVESLIPVINLWNVDFKVYDEKKHREFTGKSNALILENLRRLSRLAGPEKILITFPVIPGYNDDGENLRRMTDFMIENGLYRLEIHPYRKFSEEKHRELKKTYRDIPEVTAREYNDIYAFLRESGITPVQRTTIYSKEKCEYLKAIRRKVCEEWSLDVDIAECDIREGCIGTCPKCEQELHEITVKKEKELLEAEDL